MKLTAQIKLLPTKEQYNALKQTLATANAACNHISECAWNSNVFGQFRLHKLVYADVRERYGIGAQMVVRCIAKVADSYKLDKRTKRTFKEFGAVAYDSRNLRWYTEKSNVTIWTINGRERISYACGKQQKHLLQFQQGESDLVYHDGAFYLFTTCNIDDPEPEIVDSFIGVDLGIKNIATDSDGEVFSGAQVNGLRHRHRRLRAKLRSKGTKSAKRLLKKRRRKEQKFAADVNHCISKHIVAKAKDTKRGIALEELTGIRSRTTVRKSQRATHHSWAFNELRSFIEYKARLAGISVIAVNPRNTSRTCPICGCIDKRNRPNQSTFSCVSCGFAGLADHIAAVNISRRAEVNLPNAEAA